MRHRNKNYQLGRNTKQRKALLKGLLRDLVMHGKITTTEIKAKELKRQADKVIYRARTGSVSVRRDLHRIFGTRDVVNVLVDRIAPVFKDRVSGYTRITKQTKRRGDNTQMVSISLVEMPENMGSLKNPNPKVAKPAAKTAKKAAPKKPAVKKTAKPAKKAAPKKAAAKKAAPKKTTKTAKK